MILIDFVVNFGESTYIGSSSFWKDIAPYVGTIASGLISYFIAKKSFERTNEKDRIKEEKRLKDVKMILYHFLILQCKSLTAQILNINEKKTELQEDIKEDILNSEYRKLNIILDIYPNQLRNISTDDVFKILLSESHKNDEARQELFTQFYHRNEILIKLLDSMEEFAQNERKAYEEILLLSYTKINSIDTMLRKIHNSHFDEIIKTSNISDPFHFKLVAILENRGSLRTLDSIISNYLLPIKQICLNPDNYTKDDYSVQFPVLILEVEQYRRRIIDKKQGQIENLTSWVNHFIGAREIIMKFLKIEYGFNFDIADFEKRLQNATKEKKPSKTLEV